MEAIYQKLCSGKPLTVLEQEWLYEYLYESHKLEDTGWVKEVGIFELNGRYWKGIYYHHDRYGIKFDKNAVFQEVELKPVTRMDWVPKNSD